MHPLIYPSYKSALMGTTSLTQPTRRSRQGRLAQTSTKSAA